MGTSKRDQVIADFIKLPGVSPRNANQLYDLGFTSLKELAGADANYLFRLGINRQLASNIERVMDIWEDSGGSVDDAVARFKGKRSGRSRGAGQGGGSDGSRADGASGEGEGGGSGKAGGVRSRRVLTDDGVVRSMKVCTVCKNLVKVAEGEECPHCRDNPVMIEGRMVLEDEEDREKERRKRLKRKLNEVDRLLDNCDQDGISTTHARKVFVKAPEAFADDDLDGCERFLKKTITLVEVERVKRRKELDKERRRLSGEIDDGKGVKWDLRHKGRLALWYRWRRGLVGFVTPPSYEDTRYERKLTSKMAFYIRVFFWLFMISVAIFLVILFIITVLIYFDFLDVSFKDMVGGHSAIWTFITVS